MWQVYILKLANGAYYVGITNNLPKRMKTHKIGKGSKCVKAHLPFVLIYTEDAKNRSEASKREAAIKKMTRKNKEKLVGESNVK